MRTFNLKGISVQFALQYSEVSNKEKKLYQKLHTKTSLTAHLLQIKNAKTQTHPLPQQKVISVSFLP